MKARHFWTLAVAMALLVPTSLAASGFEAARVDVAGASQLAGAAAAVFLVADERAFTWDVTATRATIERAVESDVAVDGLQPDGPPLARFGVSDARTTTEHVDVHLTSAGADPEGALLARAAGYVAASAESGGLLSIATVEDPRFVQGDPTDVDTRRDRVGPIHEGLEGAFLLASAEDSTVTLTGDFVLDAFGVSYTLQDAQGAVDERTGFIPTAPGHERVERHRIFLEDATLRIHAAGPVHLALRDATLDVSGVFEATGPDGALLSLPDARALHLTRAGALLALQPADAPVALAATTVQPGPSLVPYAAGAAVLALLAGLALLALRRRGQGDDLELALVAMAERRWDDALPRLTRVARRRPDDAAVLLDRALCLEQLGRHGEAAKAYESALRRAPRSADAHFYYARTLAKMRERDAARVHLEAALEYDPRLVELTRGEPVLRGL